MRVWVTGARGFVGSWLVPRLLRAGADVVGVDREVDVTDAERVEQSLAAAAPEAVVHLAAHSSVAASWRRPEEAARVNALGTACVLRAAARRAPRARVLLVTSGEIYGPCPAPDAAHDEDAPLAPASPYARSKAAADLLGEGYAARGLDVVRARPFNHTGPGQSEAFVAPAFARQIAAIEAGLAPAELRVGNLDAVRDFLDVEDVVEAYARLLEPAAPPGPYNVASGEGIPVRRVLEGLLALSPTRPEVRVDEALWRPASAARGSAGRLRRATGWKPQVPLAETLRRLLDHWRERVRAA